MVPYDEFACALMYFTGSAHFNRSMRNLAGKMGMSLNEHGLFTGVVRKVRDLVTVETSAICTCVNVIVACMCVNEVHCSLYIYNFLYSSSCFWNRHISILVSHMGW